MKVIFIQEVKDVARRDDVREVSDGYALNYLLPQGLAIRATPAALTALSQRSTHAAETATQELSAAQGLAGRLKGQVVAVQARAADTGKLYAAVSASAVARAISTAFGVTVASNQVSLLTPIKSLGEHTVTVQLRPNVSTTLTVRVVKK